MTICARFPGTAEPLGLRLPLDAAGKLGALLPEHGLVVLEDAQLDDDAFVGLARTLGEPTRVGRFRTRASPFVRVQSNVPGLGAVSTGEFWHADGPLEDPPIRATLLICDEAPGSTGATLFVDMREAFARLPGELAERVSGLRGRYSRRLSHPLVRRHPVSGRRALYLNERWLGGVAGCDAAESRAILAELYAVATDPAFLYEHRWRARDLLVWDNAVVMHKGMPAYGGRKVTRRITVRG